MWFEEVAQEVFLQPGEFSFGNENTRIQTILGSCVAVTFWHSQLKVGAMCHYLLPSRAGAPMAVPSAKYGEDVLHAIADRFRLKGLRPDQIQVKVFGGSTMFPDLAASKALTIGTKNVHFALARLTQEGYQIFSCDVAGSSNRRIVFELSSGAVWVRQGHK